MTSQIQCEWSPSGCVASRGTTVEWVKRSQSRNCSLNMCHTLKCRGKHPYTHQYDEQKSPKPKLWSLYFCYREEEKILETKIKHKTGEGGKKRLQILCWMQKKMNCTSWVRHSGTKGLFPGARLLISKSTGLEDPCWSKGGVHGGAYSKMPRQQHLSRPSREWRYVLPAAWLSPPSELPAGTERVRGAWGGRTADHCTNK